MSGLRRTVWFVPVAVVAVGVLAVVVFPTRTFLAQQASMRAAEEKLAVIDEEIIRLENLIRLLNDPAEIERLARELYLLKRSGEEAYSVLPLPTPPQPPPAVGTPPADPVDDRNPLEKAWDWLAERL